MVGLSTLLGDVQTESFVEVFNFQLNICLFELLLEVEGGVVDEVPDGLVLGLELVGELVELLGDGVVPVDEVRLVFLDEVGDGVLG